MEKRAFVIEWSIPGEQWDKAREAVALHSPLSDYDRRRLGRYYLLYGDVDFAHAGSRLYGGIYGIKGINVSVMDLSVALAEAYTKEAFAPGRSTTYEQLDDDLQIQFTTDEDAVHIAATDRSEELVIQRADFTREVVAFLCSVVAACRREVGGIMEWESMTPLREFEAMNCGN